MIGNRRVGWAPQRGSQRLFLSCPTKEVLLEGNRGGGKTTALLMDFAQHVGKKQSACHAAGFGAAWRGIVFRRRYDELQDVIAKSMSLFRFWPGARFIGSPNPRWIFADGETLFFRRIDKADDYWHFHGWEIPWLGWEELTSWPSADVYGRMFSVLRSSSPGIPLKVRATANPYGVGHNWVKFRFGLPLPPGVVVGALSAPGGGSDRRAIHSDFSENVALRTAQPDYQSQLVTGTESDAQIRAWTRGDWNIVSGGMFDDVWDPRVHVMPSFDVPKSWKVDRSYDHGSSAPFSVGWWAESDGSDVRFRSGSWRSTVRGDLFRLGEWYGWNGRPNRGLSLLPSEIAVGIVERELSMGLWGRVVPGPADTGLWTTESGRSPADQMSSPVRIGSRVYPGVRWTKADKRAGSRVAGWTEIRERMKASVPLLNATREKPGLFVFDCCDQFVRTVPVLPRDESGNADDVDSDAEDHIADEVRYRIRRGRRGRRSSRAAGSVS